MLNKTLGTLVLSIGLLLSGCDDPQQNQRDLQSQEAQKAANSVRFNGQNAEIDNITKRITLTSQPGIVGYVLLMNEAGQPILYETVVGKITSGSKRLTPPNKWWYTPGGGHASIGGAPSDEGTWGSSSEYIFYWNDRGEYRQWNGKYLYSDKPFRTRQEPLIIEYKTPTPPSK